jgi:hypothetical protein
MIPGLTYYDLGKKLFNKYTHILVAKLMLFLKRKSGDNKL